MVSMVSCFVDSRGVSRLGMDEEQVGSESGWRPTSVELVLNLGREEKGTLRLTNTWVESSGAAAFWSWPREGAEKWGVVISLGG